MKTKILGILGLSRTQVNKRWRLGYKARRDIVADSRKSFRVSQAQWATFYDAVDAKRFGTDHPLYRLNEDMYKLLQIAETRLVEALK